MPKKFQKHFYFALSDTRLLAQLARLLRTSETQAVRLIIRAAVKNLTKESKPQPEGKEINENLI